MIVMRCSSYHLLYKNSRARLKRRGARIKRRGARVKHRGARLKRHESIIESKRDTIIFIDKNRGEFTDRYFQYYMRPNNSKY